MFAVFVQGFLLGLSLIIVIGAQNAFVLRQGLRGEHVLGVVLVCAVSDAILVSAGVLGFGAIVENLPWLTRWLTWGGAAFLLFYGLRSFISAFRSSEALDPAKREREAFWPTIMTAVLLTWANPHVYLDTVVLLGSISTGFGEASRVFGAGAVVASFAFFFTLGYGARIFRPWFERPGAWRVLDFCVGVVMWALAYTLVFG